MISAPSFFAAQEDVQAEKALRRMKITGKERR
jgi:hypothetical protein